MQKGFASTLLIIVLLVAAVGGAYYLGKNSDKLPLLKSGQSNTYAPPPPSSVKDETTNWKTYKGETAYTFDGSSMFIIKYPPDWLLEKNILYPYGKGKDNGLSTRIVLGAGGRGIGGDLEIVENDYPAGKARYYWENGDGVSVSSYAFAAFDTTPPKYSYIFEIYSNSPQEIAKLKGDFSLMLSTFTPEGK